MAGCSQAWMLGNLPMPEAEAIRPPPLVVEFMCVVQPSPGTGEARKHGGEDGFRLSDAYLIG